jgi:methionyl-tRNA formyltransferase
MEKLRIGYFGDGPWSHQALSRLLSDDTLQIQFVCARYDKPDPTLATMSAENGLDFYTHQIINSKESIDRLNRYGCDLFVSMSFNQIFRKELFSLPPLGTINCHAGRLPFYRGRNILNWVLINDESEFGITVHFVDEGIDTGGIILQRCYPISDVDDYASLLERAYSECAIILYDSIKCLQEGSAMPLAQKSIHPVGFYCSARRDGDERIEWNQKSRDIFNFVRAICRPGPEARTSLNGVELKINKVVYLPDAPRYKDVPGAVVGIESESFIVKTADSYIKVVEWSGCVRPCIGSRLK